MRPISATVKHRWFQLPKFVLLLSCACALGAVRASAQSNPAPGTPETTLAPLQLSVGILSAVPTGDFGANVDSAGGLSLHLGAGIGESPVTIGGEITYLFYGNESRKVPFSEAVPDALLTVNTDNEIALIHAVARAQPTAGRVRPYADVLFGFEYIYTHTSVEANGPEVSSIADTTNLSDFALNFGVGGGAMIQFSSRHSFRLDLAARYLLGGEADYLRQGAIRRENGQAILDVSRSRTNMAGVYIGLAIGR